MSKVFLKVDKDLFGSGLSPIEILVYSQIVEFNTNTGDCFISDEKLAEQFGVSLSTVSRAIKRLVELEYITKETRNVHNGRERHLKPTVKMTVANDDKNTPTVKLNVGQQSNCLLANSQNDSIKDNRKDNSLKDNYSPTFVGVGVSPQTPNQKPSEKGFVF